MSVVHMSTRLRYASHEPGVFYPCPEHLDARSLVVTSTTRRWTDKGPLPTFIQEHTPVCIECFKPLLPEGDDDGDRTGAAA